MGKGSKKRSGGGKGKQGKGGGGRHKKQKDDSGVVAKKKVPGNPFPVPGLMNLGNTCFFNSVMQSIGQSHHLKMVLDRLVASPQYSLMLTALGQQRQVTVSEAAGSLTKTLHTFMGEMVSHPASALNPRPLFSQICDKAPRFRGYQQQDSQELLRYLLDSLKMEEFHRMKRAILVAYNVSGKTRNEAISKLTERDREMIKVLGNKAYESTTFVDEVFGGSLISTVTCNQCHNCTTIHENYLDLSLPMPKDKTAHTSPGAGGGGKHQLRSRRERGGGDGRRNARANSRSGETGEEDGERVVDSPKAAATSKHQQKKARKKERKGKPVFRSLHELDQLLDRNDSEKKLEQRESENEEKREACEGTGEQSKQKGEEESGKMAEEKQNGGEMEVGGVELPEEVDRGDVSPGHGGVATGREEMKEGVEGEEERGQLLVETEALEASVRDLRLSGGNEATGQHGDDKTTESINSTNPNAEVTSAQLRRNSVDDKTTNSPTSPCQETTMLPAPNQPGTDEVAMEGAALPGQPATPTEATPTSLIQSCSPLNPVASTEDSLEGCLRRFCSPEVLTGSNRFACSICTQRKAAEKSSLQEQDISCDDKEAKTIDPQIVASGNDASQELEERDWSLEPSRESLREKREAEDGHDEEEATEEEGGKNGEGEAVSVVATEKEGGEAIDESLDKVARDSESEGEGGAGQGEGGREEQARTTSEKTDDPESSSIESADEEREESGSHEESAKESDDTGDGLLTTGSEASLKKSKSPSEEVVFSDATKQLMIKTLPPVLTLHLKRFLQEGRRLRKNGRHVTFPPILDLAPFCMTDCRDLCDGQGRLLFSLYGVVEHSGGMQGGHYTAYVRVRKPVSPAPFTTVGGIKDRLSEILVDELKGNSTSNSLTTKDERGTTIAISCQGSTTDNHRVTTTAGEDDRLATDDQTPTDGNTSTTNDQTTASKNDTIDDQTTTTHNENGATPNTPSHHLNPSNTDHQNDLEFDLSSTEGQWYHISDTHVRTALESEVGRSQAYLLFYERLPFKTT